MDAKKIESIIEAILFTMGNSVESIGSYCFRYCYALTRIELSDAMTEVKEGTFTSCSNLTRVDLPSSLFIIRNGAFSGCSSLVAISVHEGLSEVGTNAFSSCSSLQRIELYGTVVGLGSVKIGGGNDSFIAADVKEVSE